MIECIVNVSEGSDAARIATIASAAGVVLLDVHSDPVHNRSVLTLAGTSESVMSAIRSVATVSIATLDIRDHTGVHPRLGVIDVVPFVPLPDLTTPAPDSDEAARAGEGVVRGEAARSRDEFAEWLGAKGVPCFLYGSQRRLSDIRRNAFTSLEPDTGPGRPHPSAGACCVGARRSLVAYNLWLRSHDLDLARSIAASMRRTTLQAMAFDMGDSVQASFNVLDPHQLPLDKLYSETSDLCSSRGVAIDHPELVGLLPARALYEVQPRLWNTLDLSVTRTVEWRLWNPPLIEGNVSAR